LYGDGKHGIVKVNGGFEIQKVRTCRKKTKTNEQTSNPRRQKKARGS